MSKSFTYLLNEVEIWGRDRQIIQNSNPTAQAVKTLEEVTELLNACHMNDRDEMADAYGDILVTLIIGSAIADLDLVECLGKAYNEIKGRKGWLDSQGVFHKVKA